MRSSCLTSVKRRRSPRRRLRSSIAPSRSAAPQAGQKPAPAGTAAERCGHAPSTPTVEDYAPMLTRSTGRRPDSPPERESSSEMNLSRPSYRSMPLSNVQKGAIGQFAFLATALVTGKGKVEVYTPGADNEGRDAEIRRHLKPAPPIGIQIKVGFYETVHRGSAAKYLSLRFSILESRVQNDPRLWYFFAFYDMRELRFHGPVFLIPSHVFHRMGRTGKQGRRIWFAIYASLAAESNDRWFPYRVAPGDLGKRLLEIIDEAPLTASSRAVKLPPDSVWIGRARRSMARSKRDRAA